MNQSVCVVGSVALDSVDTPSGSVRNLLGGASTFFSVAASFFAPVNLVGVVGTDFPDSERQYLASRGINLEGLHVADGKTFRWHGRYPDHMNTRETLDLQLNVFEHFQPKLPNDYLTSDFVFLANIHPGLQLNVLSQFKSPKFVGADSMDHWIQTTPTELEQLMAKVDLFSINDNEARLLSKRHNLVRAAQELLAMGPKYLIIKRGEYGALHFAANDIFAIPAFPLEDVIDPTGAGDAFAGGVFGYLASQNEVTQQSLRKAIAYGTVVASFTVEAFSLNRLKTLDRDDIEKRYRQFMALTDFHSERF